jgi:hypothetical protein
MFSAVALALRMVVGGCRSSGWRGRCGAVSARAGHSSMQVRMFCRRDPAEEELSTIVTTHTLVLLYVVNDTMLNNMSIMDELRLMV